MTNEHDDEAEFYLATMLQMAAVLSACSVFLFGPHLPDSWPLTDPVPN